MIKLKTSKEIGDFIQEKIKNMNIKPIELAEKLANAKGEGYDKKNLRDLVYKWINGDRTPGIDYIYHLSKILRNGPDENSSHVSIEEILDAGEICEKYEDRPFTLYAIAKSNNFDQLDKIMQTRTTDGTIVGTNYDEYNKTILDYAVEFENIDLIKYMIEKEYLHFSSTGSHLSTIMHIGGQGTYFDMVMSILKLAIKEDDVMLFSKIIPQREAIWIEDSDEDDVYFYSEYREGITLKKDMLINMLNTEKIFKYLTTPYESKEDDWCYLNLGITYCNKDRMSMNDKLSKIERLPEAFNVLFDIAIKTNSEKLKYMLEIIKKHNMNVAIKLRRFYGDNEIRIDKYGNYKNGPFGSLSMVGKVQKSTIDVVTDEILKEQLKKYL